MCIFSNHQKKKKHLKLSEPSGNTLAVLSPNDSLPSRARGRPFNGGQTDFQTEDGAVFFTVKMKKERGVRSCGAVVVGGGTEAGSVRRWGFLQCHGEFFEAAEVSSRASSITTAPPGRAESA